MSTAFVRGWREPGHLVQGLWFPFLGWWAGLIWPFLAWAFALIIIGTPSAVEMVSLLPSTLAQREIDPRLAVIQAGDVTVVDVSGALPQRSLLLRIIYFVLTGVWLSATWMLIAFAPCLTIIRKRIDFWLFDGTGAVLSLHDHRARCRPGSSQCPRVAGGLYAAGAQPPSLRGRAATWSRPTDVALARIASADGP